MTLSFEWIFLLVCEQWLPHMTKGHLFTIHEWRDCRINATSFTFPLSNQPRNPVERFVKSFLQTTWGHVWYSYKSKQFRLMFWFYTLCTTSQNLVFAFWALSLTSFFSGRETWQLKGRLSPTMLMIICSISQVNPPEEAPKYSQIRADSNQTCEIVRDLHTK